jgi:hypothetical protein
MLVRMADLRSQVIELIEISLVELRGIAQPHEVASLNELLLDAREAETSEQALQIEAQVKSLRDFCEKRARSAAAFHAVLPPGRRRV